ncbi:hypothetical protein J5X84_19770 [Streptosporangiaceae bacterium NEAU-GS5]|nr:hypothetical protein [Streptosporangiaceae bacterium NEAU-GS5]
MQEVLLVAVVVLTVLTLVNLLLVLGLVRRIREYEARSAVPSGPPSQIMKPVGSRVGRFETRSADGAEVSDAVLLKPSLVGFLSPGCDACHDRLDAFRAAAAAHDGPVLAVVVRDGGDMEEMVEAVRGAAIVIEEDIGGPVTMAFGVVGFPVFARLGPGGVVLASGFELPLPA